MWNKYYYIIISISIAKFGYDSCMGVYPLRIILFGENLESTNCSQLMSCVGN